MVIKQGVGAGGSMSNIPAYTNNSPILYFFSFLHLSQTRAALTISKINMKIENDTYGPLAILNYLGVCRRVGCTSQRRFFSNFFYKSKKEKKIGRKSD